MFDPLEEDNPGSKVDDKNSYRYIIFESNISVKSGVSTLNGGERGGGLHIAKRLYVQIPSLEWGLDRNSLRAM